MSSSSASYKLQPTYGKQSVPVFKIRKEGPRHSVVDMVVEVMLEGQIGKSWLSGDNSEIVPTETQKNTCYAIALQTEYTSIEDFCIALARDLLSRHHHIETVRLRASERVWERAKVGGAEHSHVFVTSVSPVRRTAQVAVTRSVVRVTSGVCDIKLMKTTQSGFKGYIQDKYTNLQPVGDGESSPDRIMCTQMVAEWTYAVNQAPLGRFQETNARVLDLLLTTFGGPAHEGVFSKSLQETAYQMCTNVLDAVPQIQEVYLCTPNVHFYTYPLAQFGLHNPNIVFQSTDSQTTASGRIVTRVLRDDHNARL